MAPSRPTRRAGSMCSPSHAAATSPMTMAAVEAMLASTQEPATTVAVRHGPAVGRPVAGSMMWCRTTPPRVHLLTEVLDVAQYSEITLTSQAVEKTGDTLRVQAALTMKSRTRTVPLTVRVLIGPDTLRATTTFTVRQSDYGIRPYRGGPGGTVRVADAVSFDIDAIALRRP